MKRLTNIHIYKIAACCARPQIIISIKLHMAGLIFALARFFLIPPFYEVTSHLWDMDGIRPPKLLSTLSWRSFWHEDKIRNIHAVWKRKLHLAFRSLANNSSVVRSTSSYSMSEFIQILRRTAVWQQLVQAVDTDYKCMAQVFSVQNCIFTYLHRHLGRCRHPGMRRYPRVYTHLGIYGYPWRCRYLK